MRTTAIQPVVSEKAMALIEQGGIYTFTIPEGMSKPEVSKAISRQFKVKVKEVNMLNVQGKPKTAVVKRGRRQLKGQRRDFKKAYVHLHKGESIKLFEEPQSDVKSKKDKK